MASFFAEKFEDAFGARNNFLDDARLIFCPQDLNLLDSYSWFAPHSLVAIFVNLM